MEKPNKRPRLDELSAYPDRGKVVKVTDVTTEIAKVLSLCSVGKQILTLYQSRVYCRSYKIGLYSPPWRNTNSTTAAEGIAEDANAIADNKIPMTKFSDIAGLKSVRQVISSAKGTFVCVLFERLRVLKLPLVDGGSRVYLRMPDRPDLNEIPYRIGLNVAGTHLLSWYKDEVLIYSLDDGTLVASVKKPIGVQCFCAAALRSNGSLVVLYKKLGENRLPLPAVFVAALERSGNAQPPPLTRVPTNELSGAILNRYKRGRTVMTHGETIVQWVDGKRYYDQLFLDRKDCVFVCGSHDMCIYDPRLEERKFVYDHPNSFSVNPGLRSHVRYWLDVDFHFMYVWEEITYGSMRVVNLNRYDKSGNREEDEDDDDNDDGDDKVDDDDSDDDDCNNNNDDDNDDDDDDKEEEDGDDDDDDDGE